MNKRQAKRIALAVEGSYIVFGASSDGITDLLSDVDMRMYCEAQKELGFELLRRAGFDEPLDSGEILEKVLGGKFPTYLQNLNKKEQE